jgi:methylene-fatty-acyl-phospholipid synthase
MLADSIEFTWQRAAAYASVAAASAFYTWIWLRPEQFRKLAGARDPCQAMASVSNVIKLAQFTTVVAATNWAAVQHMPLWQWVAMAVLAVVGQHLNFLVFHHLGVDGTYYGVRFGKQLPWVHAYPFGYVKDPQYVGSSISLLGACFIAPVDVCLFWIANYIYLIWLERDNDRTHVGVQGGEPAAAAAVAPVSKKSKSS